MKRWEGKVAVVTGASAGIGAAIVGDLVKNGLQVVGIARRKDRLDALNNTPHDQKGKFHPYVGDISKESDIVAAFDFAKKLGPIHILINNAGFMKLQSMGDGDLEKWRKVLEVNVLGLSVATREAVRDMKHNGVDGHIVHINSVCGHKVIAGDFGIYTASKYAVTALTETLRLELNSLGLKIKVSSVSPGFVSTEFQEVAGFTKEQVEGWTKVLPKPLTPEDISDAVLYVLSTPPHVQVHELMLRPVGQAD